MPKALTNGKIENVPIGSNEISIGFVQKATKDQFAITQKSTGWSVVFSQPKGKYKKWVVNNRTVAPKLVGDYEQITLSRKMNTLQLLK